MDFIIPLALIGLIIFQQLFYLRQIQKLLDKLMSRSYMEYKTAEKPVQRANKKENIIPEDFGVLSEFQTL